MRECISRFVMLLPALMLWTAPVFAQTQPAPAPPTRPSEGLYRGDRVDENSRQSLVFTGSLLGAYDDNIIGSEAALSPIGAQLRRNGYYSRAEGRLLYGRRIEAVKFVGGGGARLDFYPDLPSVDQPIDSYDGNAGLDIAIGRGSLRLFQSLSYQPYFALDPSPALFMSTIAPAPAVGPIVAGADVTLFSEPVTTYSSSAGFTTPLGRRASFDASYAYHGSTSPQRWTDTQDQGGAVRVSWAMGRRSSVNVGYSHRLTTYEPPGRDRVEITGREVQVGYSYRRSLSQTRSVAFEVGTGGALLDGDVTTTGHLDTQRQVLGYGSVTYQFGRSWSARGNYRRSLQVVRGLSETFFGDSVTGGVDGLLGRRVDVGITGLYSNADGGLSIFSQGYDTRNAAARLRYALSRNFAISTEYMYAYYRFSPLVELPPGVLRQVSRNVFRVGLTFGTSLIGRP